MHGGRPDRTEIAIEAATRAREEGGRDRRQQDPGKESWLADTLLWLLCDCVIRVEEEGRGETE